MQDFAFAFVESHEASANPFLQPVEILLQCLALQGIDCSPSFGSSVTLVEVHPIPLPRFNEDIKQYQTQQ